MNVFEMKKWMLLLLATFAISSCSSDDGNEAVFVLIPVENVVMPATYAVDSISVIEVKYRRPTDCHFFNDFFVKTNGNASIIGIESVILSHDDCAPDPDTVFAVPFEFKPESAGVYFLRFWTGDVGGMPQYIEHTVIVE